MPSPQGFRGWLAAIFASAAMAGASPGRSPPSPNRSWRRSWASIRAAASVRAT